jgi:hypothetical protein
MTKKVLLLWFGVFYNIPLSMESHSENNFEKNQGQEDLSIIINGLDSQTQEAIIRMEENFSKKFNCYVNDYNILRETKVLLIYCYNISFSRFSQSFKDVIQTWNNLKNMYQDESLLFKINYKSKKIMDLLDNLNNRKIHIDQVVNYDNECAMTNLKIPLPKYNTDYIENFISRKIDLENIYLLCDILDMSMENRTNYTNYFIKLMIELNIKKNTKQYNNRLMSITYKANHKSQLMLNNLTSEKTSNPLKISLNVEEKIKEFTSFINDIEKNFLLVFETYFEQFFIKYLGEDYFSDIFQSLYKDRKLDDFKKINMNMFVSFFVDFYKKPKEEKTSEEKSLINEIKNKLKSNEYQKFVELSQDQKMMDLYKDIKNIPPIKIDQDKILEVTSLMDTFDNVKILYHLETFLEKIQKENTNNKTKKNKKKKKEQGPIDQTTCKEEEYDDVKPLYQEDIDSLNQDIQNKNHLDNNKKANLREESKIRRKRGESKDSNDELVDLRGKGSWNKYKIVHELIKESGIKTSSTGSHFLRKNADGSKTRGHISREKSVEKSLSNIRVRIDRQLRELDYQKAKKEEEKQQSTITKQKSLENTGLNLSNQNKFSNQNKQQKNKINKK